MADRRTPREVRFVCQQCGQWTVYTKTTPGCDRYICDDCLPERKLANNRTRYRVEVDRKRKEQQTHEAF